MGRLFAGTPWDRPPACERCGAPEAECRCPPPAPPEAAPVDPATLTARLVLQKRPKGKTATVVTGLTDRSDHLPALAARLKAACGSGGTVKDGTIEIQGDHRERAAAELARLGYRVRR